MVPAGNLKADAPPLPVDPAALAEGRRVVLAEHVAPWADFARLAMTGEKTLVMLTSEIPIESYAGTHEVGRAVAEAVGAEIVEVSPAEGQTYPLHFRADAGSFHWWCYAGTDGVAHMTLARRIADAWQALDAAGAL
ncbi:MAG: hypothetical protein HC888_17765 [Candidatus Competibacteraceae bacterium]|nr:hypothetical protein [Candidatus Competibacteraceae bacterium]